MSTNLSFKLARLASITCITILLIVSIPTMAVHATQGPAAMWVTTANRPSWGAALPAAASIPGVPITYQQHRLSCEAASVSMAVWGAISEQTILDSMPHDPDPNRGFRGDVDAPAGETLSNGLRDYGIMNGPLAATMTALGFQAQPFDGPSAPWLLRYAIGILHLPVVVWITYRLAVVPPLVVIVHGHTIHLFMGEHANVVTGYSPQGVDVHDPVDGAGFYPWGAFLRAWEGEFGGASLLVVAHRLRVPPVMARLIAPQTLALYGLLPGSTAHVAMYFDKIQSNGRPLLLHAVAPTVGAKAVFHLSLTSGQPYAGTVIEATPPGITATTTIDWGSFYQTRITQPLRVAACRLKAARLGHHKPCRLAAIIVPPPMPQRIAAQMTTVPFRIGTLSAVNSPWHWHYQPLQQ